MIATIATTLVTAFGIGHIDRAGDMPHSSANLVRGSELAIALPPRTAVYSMSRCNWLMHPRVAINVGTDGETMPRGQWIDEHSVLAFGRVSFDGISFTNYSNRWATVQADIFNGCKR